MSSLGNFLLGSYVTGFFFMMFFVEQMSGESADSISRNRANIGERVFAGIIWPVAAVCFLLGRIHLFFVGK